MFRPSGAPFLWLTSPKAYAKGYRSIAAPRLAFTTASKPKRLN